MTALVGIMNKRGAAIAADSAMTIFGNGSSKIYNNEQKIFQLSDQNPVGVMICNNLNFLATPLSLIFELYRSERGSQKHPSLSDYVEDFIKYLKSLTRLQVTDVKNIYYRREFVELLDTFKAVFNERYDQLLEEDPDVSDDEPSRSCYEYTFEVLKKVIYEEKINPRLKGFSKAAFVKEVIKPNKDFFDHHRETFPRMTDKEWDKLLNYFNRDLIINNFGSTQVSEIIFVGFGSDDIFPASQRVYISGMVGDEIKYDIEEISKITHDNSAEIRPFAQTDVMFTLMQGVSPQLNKEYIDSTEELENSVISEIVTLLEKEKVSASVIDKIKNISLDSIHDRYIDRISNFVHENYSDSVVDVLEFFNMEEMAKMAENLIAVTNLQRHISSSEESVGGPIEVAILTKIGGFKWIKHNNL